VRRLAHTAGVDLSQVIGTGPNGRVRPTDVSAAAAQVSTNAAGDVTTYVVELDLTSISMAARDQNRAAVLGAVVGVLLAAVRRVCPVTDVEIVSAEGARLIPRAHDLSQDAMVSRIASVHADGVTTSRPIIAVVDAQHSGPVFSISEPAPDRLLSASLGPVELRPVARPGPTGYPDISFRSTAFLGVSCRRAELDPMAVAGILSTVTGLLRGRDRETRPSS